MPRYLVSLSNNCLALTLQDSLPTRQVPLLPTSETGLQWRVGCGTLSVPTEFLRQHMNVVPLWQISRCRMGWGQILLAQICPALGLSISSETKVREAQQVVGKHTVFLPLRQGQESKGLTEVTSHI